MKDINKYARVYYYIYRIIDLCLFCNREMFHQSPVISFLNMHKRFYYDILYVCHTNVFLRTYIHFDIETLCIFKYSCKMSTLKKYMFHSFPFRKCFQVYTICCVHNEPQTSQSKSNLGKYSVELFRVIHLICGKFITK